MIYPKYFISVRPGRGVDNNQHDEDMGDTDIRPDNHSGRENRPGFKFTPSKWETVDESQLEAQGNGNI